MKQIGPEFFQRDPVTCARELIGCVFRWGGCETRIVETEAYHAVGDAACHTFNRPAARDFVSRHEAGTAYVYLNYGVHWLFNFLTKNELEIGFVLLRSLEPLSGFEVMRPRRPASPDHLLCAGPGRLTKALGIDGTCHGSSCLRDGHCEILSGPEVSILAGPRIGISKDADLPWRFGAATSAALSRKFPTRLP